MKNFACTLGAWLGFLAFPVHAWNNHTLPSYRAFEVMPEVANAAPVIVEPLEVFLKTEEKTIEALLASQEAWALSNLVNYPARPAELAFVAHAQRPDDARRQAFFQALRIAPNSKFALFVQHDPKSPPTGAYGAHRIPVEAVSTQPLTDQATQKFYALRTGETVSALSVLATATDEPDYGLDMHLWENSPSDWGKTYGFGPLPYGNSGSAAASQAPFHEGFMHESEAVYAVLPALRRNLVQLRVYQFSTLSALAFRTNHPYWGWRFAGMALHYIQDLSQPYHASFAPGKTNFHVVIAQALSALGLPRRQHDMHRLLSNQRMVFERYVAQQLLQSALLRQDSVLEQSLRACDRENQYPEWHPLYLRDVVSAQASSNAQRLVRMVIEAFPPAWTSDPDFDASESEEKSMPLPEMGRPPAATTTALHSVLSELLCNLASHSRVAVRGILKASGH